MESVVEFGVVQIGVITHELDDLAIAVGGFAVLAAGLIDHAEAVVPVVHLRVVHEKLACGLLGFIELACLHQGNDGIGILGEIALVLEGLQGGFGLSSCLGGRLGGLRGRNGRGTLEALAFGVFILF